MTRSWACSAGWPPAACGSSPPRPPGLAGLAHELRAGRMDVTGKRVVAVCTGHGMKDPDIIAQSMPAPRKLAARVQELEAFILEGNK